MVDVTFYKDEDKRAIRPELFSTVAESLAKELAEAGKNVNKRTQIRKFYDEVLRLNSLAHGASDNWDAILPYVGMLVAKAVYAEGRRLVSRDFTSFIRAGVSQVETPGDLDVFSSLFEAFMGFYKKYGPQN